SGADPLVPAERVVEVARFVVVALAVVAAELAGASAVRAVRIWRLGDVAERRRLRASGRSRAAELGLVAALGADVLLVEVVASKASVAARSRQVAAGHPLGAADLDAGPGLAHALSTEAGVAGVVGLDARLRATARAGGAEDSAFGVDSAGLIGRAVRGVRAGAAAARRGLVGHRGAVAGVAALLAGAAAVP